MAWQRIIVFVYTIFNLWTVGECAIALNISNNERSSVTFTCKTTGDERYSAIAWDFGVPPISEVINAPRGRFSVPGGESRSFTACAGRDNSSMKQDQCNVLNNFTMYEHDVETLERANTFGPVTDYRWEEFQIVEATTNTTICDKKFSVLTTKHQSYVLHWSVQAGQRAKINLHYYRINKIEASHVINMHRDTITHKKVPASGVHGNVMWKGIVGSTHWIHFTLQITLIDRTNIMVSVLRNEVSILNFTDTTTGTNKERLLNQLNVQVFGEGGLWKLHEYKVWAARQGSFNDMFLNVTNSIQADRMMFLYYLFPQKMNNTASLQTRVSTRTFRPFNTSDNGWKFDQFAVNEADGALLDLKFDAPFNNDTMTYFAVGDFRWHNPNEIRTREITVNRSSLGGRTVSCWALRSNKRSNTVFYPAPTTTTVSTTSPAAATTTSEELTPTSEVPQDNLVLFVGVGVSCILVLLLVGLLIWWRRHRSANREETPWYARVGGGRRSEQPASVCFSTLATNQSSGGTHYSASPSLASRAPTQLPLPTRTQNSSQNGTTHKAQAQIPIPTRATNGSKRSKSPARLPEPTPVIKPAQGRSGSKAPAKIPSTTEKQKKPAKKAALPAAGPSDQEDYVLPSPRFAHPAAEPEDAIYGNLESLELSGKGLPATDEEPIYGNVADIQPAVGPWTAEDSRQKKEEEEDIYGNWEAGGGTQPLPQLTEDPEESIYGNLEDLKKATKAQDPPQGAAGTTEQHNMPLPPDEIYGNFGVDAPYTVDDEDAIYGNVTFHK